ncbi:G-patch domain [Mycena sanguinolenta]|uniref:G-patch domain n=1 Tax=Mycena sanguinolenta TaxID=230812 RepID=A0A8H6Z5F5_9AGAR|nr:G-patch domain [Mycena sanguinolenta]
MSSRLKKKLGNLGVDPSSARANESFCLIGTPLPPLEKSKDSGEFVPLWKQDVRDEQGRRRLHGAFTGGFSAGYFNTVGSKEGWTPSTFVSSRSARAQKKAARPEDYMDEEDLQELRDSRNVVDTTDEMDLTGGTKPGNGDDEEQDSIARTLEASMLPAAKDSAGARILKKMGWRIGQGIGPRVTLRQRKLQDLQASGRRVTEADVVIPEDEEAAKHTYAPRDTPVLVVDRKDNSHGLGYHPGMGLSESVGGGRSGATSGPKLAAGFGLGALNDADEDDLDVYDGGFVQNRNRTAYDIIDREEDEKISIGGKAVSRSRSSTMPATSTQTFHDGKPVLAGFVLSDKPVAEDRWFPLPDIPKSWKPNPKRVWDKENSQEPTPASQTAPEKSEKWSRTGISADQRGSMLRETPLPHAPRSVFEYMSQKDRERLQNIASRGPVTGDARIDDSASSPPCSTISYNNSPDRTTHCSCSPPRRLCTLRHGSSQASTLYFLPRVPGHLRKSSSPRQNPCLDRKSTSSIKSSKTTPKQPSYSNPFPALWPAASTSASIVEHGLQMNEGLYTPTAEDLAKKEAELQKAEEEKVTPKVHAARLGMYGPMTRETQPWQPAKLLCKRFKVKDPNPSMEMPADETPQAAAYAEPTNAASGSGWDQFAASSDSAAGTSIASGGRRDLTNIGLGEDDAQGRDTLTYQRPAMDVFKAIFASDDEDSDDEAKDDNDDELPPPPAAQDAVLLPHASASATDVVVPDAVVDVGTFKPTFIPREGKAKKDSSRATKEKKEKKKKEKVLVSFQEDEDGPLQISVKDRPKKKRRKDKQADDEDGMWVEKPAPDVVKAFAVPASSEPVEPPVSEPQAPKGRKRAIDFM